MLSVCSDNSENVFRSLAFQQYSDLKHTKLHTTSSKRKHRTDKTDSFQMASDERRLKSHEKSLES